MSVYHLTGAGAVGLSANVSRLLVDVTSFASNRTIGRATPPNYYDLGLLRFGVQGSYGPTMPIDATSMFMDCPEGLTTLGYSLFGTTAVTVTEQFATGAPGGLHVPNLNFNNNLASGSGSANLVSYTVPAGQSALVEALFLTANIGSNANEVLLAVYFGADILFYDIIVGPVNNALTGSDWSPLLTITPLRMNAGEQFILQGGNLAGPNAIQFIASASVLEYPQPMW